jgi:hypothetical protein
MIEFDLSFTILLMNGIEILKTGRSLEWICLIRARHKPRHRGQWLWCPHWLALCPQKFLSHFPFAKAMPSDNSRPWRYFTSAMAPLKSEGLQLTKLLCWVVLCTNSNSRSSFEYSSISNCRWDLQNPFYFRLYIEYPAGYWSIKIDYSRENRFYWSKWVSTFICCGHAGRHETWKEQEYSYPIHGITNDPAPFKNDMPGILCHTSACLFISPPTTLYRFFPAINCYPAVEPDPLVINGRDTLKMSFNR